MCETNPYLNLSALSDKELSKEFTLAILNKPGLPDNGAERYHAVREEMRRR